MAVRGFSYAAIILTAVLYGSRASAADVVADGDDFAIDLSVAQACFVIPQELRAAEPCRGFKPDSVKLPTSFGPSRLLALALLHLPDGQTGLVQVMATLAKVTSMSSASASRDVDDFARAQSEDLQRSVKPKRAWVDERGALGLVRGTLDIDEPNGSKAAELMAHQSLILGYSDGKSYSVIISGPASSRVAIDHLAEQIANAERLPHPVPVVESNTTISYELGRWLVRLTVLGAAVLVTFLLLRSSKRRPGAG